MALVVAAPCGAFQHAHAQAPAGGVTFTSELLRPGKLDLISTIREAGAEEVNLIWWGPSIKAGVGVLDSPGPGETKYAGGFFRPLAGTEGKGDLIVGLQIVSVGGDEDSEAQFEYRLPVGVGVGGGLVARSGGAPDVWFAKASFRRQMSGWSLILSGQVQEYGSEGSVGGYGAVYNDVVMGVAGYDGEQWRTAFGMLAPVREGSPVRPALELLFVDNSIGSVAGPEFLFVNGTLGYSGGFLSHPARLGRAMGPGGLEFGNPLGFLRPTFNRRLNPWELGGLAGFRLVRLSLPNGNRVETWEAVAFPFQLAHGDRGAIGAFIGASYSRPIPADDRFFASIGHYGTVGWLTVSARVEVDTSTGDASLTVGLIDFF